MAGTDSRPTELFDPRYWTDLVATAERALLDFVGIEDSLRVPGDRHTPSDEAVDQVRARIDAHLIAEAKNLNLREVVLDQFERGPLVGTPAQVAEQIDAFVQNDGSDGFILGSHLAPWGLDEFVDKVVPLLQDRGALRTAYTGTTLRDNLGLPDVRSATTVPARS